MFPGSGSGSGSIDGIVSDSSGSGSSAEASSSPLHLQVLACMHWDAVVDWDGNGLETMRGVDQGGNGRYGTFPSVRQRKKNSTVAKNNVDVDRARRRKN